MLERVPHQSALPVGHDRYVALAAPALGSAEAHQPFADVVALRPHRGAQLGARGDAERGARRVVGLELGGIAVSAEGASLDRMYGYLTSLKPGDPIAVRVLRAGKVITLTGRAPSG